MLLNQKNTTCIVCLESNFASVPAIENFTNFCKKKPKLSNGTGCVIFVLSALSFKLGFVCENVYQNIIFCLLALHCEKKCQ